MKEKNRINSFRSEDGLISVVLILLIIVIVGFVFYWVKQNIYASQFTPTKLSSQEQKVLDIKLNKIERSAYLSGNKPIKGKPNVTGKPLEPEPYTEKDEDREIRLTEKELNAIVAKDSDVARKVAIDLADDLVSVKLLVPMDEDFPILGGKTIRLKFGTKLAYEDEKPVVAMRGISLGGVPLPSAWWGDIKNKNLVEYFGGGGGFWDQFAKGVADIKIQEGQLYIKLKE